VRVRNSVFVSEYGNDAGRKVCYMFLGWLVGSLEYVGHAAGMAYKLEAEEVACGSDGAQDGCVFEVRPEGQ
jgi:predicted hydrocarbon binding protein